MLSFPLGLRIWRAWLYVVLGAGLIAVVIGDFLTESLIPSFVAIILVVAATAVIKRSVFPGATAVIAIAASAFTAVTVAVVFHPDLVSAPVAVAGAAMCLTGISSKILSGPLPRRALAAAGWIVAALCLLAIAWAIAFVE